MHHAPATVWAMRLRARRDLRVRASTDRRATTYFNVLDPLTRQSYRIGVIERALLAALNGNRTLAQVLQLLRRDSQFEALDENQLLVSVEQLQRSGLVRASGRVAQSLSASAQHAARAQATLSGFVVWQLRGLQPDAWLAKLAPHTNSIFSGAAVRFWMVAAMLTCCGVFLEFQRLASQSTSWQWIVHPAQGTALFAVFLCTRALHELGHALACKRHGIRCPDIGLFLILGAPCVYCDVSESWQLPSRWQRAAVAAAGMYVELIVATMAAWVWLATVDGPTNTVALQTMFVCSVSTLLINANPLMRFDGYYILSDILDESNLRGRADGIAESRLYRWVLGKAAMPRANATDHFYSHALCVFSWLGWGYRAGLSLAIAGLLVTIYESWNIAWFGRLIAVLILISWWGVPSVKLAKNLVQTARKTRTSWRLALGTAALVGCICLLPVPYRQFATGWVQPSSMQGVYAAAQGILDNADLPPAGAMVATGQPLFRIHDLRIHQESIRAAGLQRIALKNLQEQQRRRHLQDTQQIDLASADAAVEITTLQAENAQRELERLFLKAPRGGRLLVMPAAPQTGPWDLDADAFKHSWSSATQIGRTVAEGTMLAAICDAQLTAVIPLNDKQLQWIATDTEVRLRGAEQAEKVYTGRVQAVVLLSDATATWRLMNGDLDGSGSVSGNASPQGDASAAYAALVQLPAEVAISTGTRIDAVFIVPSQTLAAIGFRWLQQNLRWLAD
jgi:putative peptide zinc metalloprotease protein